MSREIDKDISGGIPHIFYEHYYLNDFATPDTLIGYFSKNKEFSNYGGRTVEFYFYENHLYAVHVDWNLDLKNEIIRKAKENYGNEYELIKETNTWTWPSHITYYSDIYKWDSKNKKIFLNDTKSYSGQPTLTLTVFSKNLIQQYKTDLKEKEERQRQHAENERKRNSDRIRF